MSGLVRPLISRRRAEASGSGLPSMPDLSIPKPKKKTAGRARNIQMFLHGGESSIVTEHGDYNIHRLVPRYVKYYLNWTRDTFPSIVRLSWTSLMIVFISIKLVTIAFFAMVMNSLDSYGTPGVCVTNASSYMDFFYFVVQTIFTIGYGAMSPVCHWSNSMVTVISFFGMFQLATFTGVFFAKFSMDPKRNFACAFTTRLIGVPPRDEDDNVKFNFRFVNVFHRRYFGVSCRLFLIEHRMNPVTEKWFVPLVEELDTFDTSAPLEFMSLPIEVCTYIPFSRLVKFNVSGSSTPLIDVADRSHQWVRHHSKSSKTKQGGGPGVNFTASPDVPINSEFEVVCILIFTDATTGCEIAVRKSWPLSETLWLTERKIIWQDIVHRDGTSDAYLVDVAGLDFIDNNENAIISEEGIASPIGGSPEMSPAYRLINTMTVPARTGIINRPSAMTLFPSIHEV